MTRAKALLMMLQIVDECSVKQGAGNSSCRECVFGTDGGSCLVSAGNDIPTDWNITTKIDKWVNEVAI